MEMVLKVARAGRLGLRLDIQSFSMPSFGKSDFRHIVLRNAQSLSKLSLIQVDEVLVLRSLENTKLANPLNLLNLDLVRMWGFCTTPPKRLRVQSSWAAILWTFKTGFEKWTNSGPTSSTPHLHPKSLELALNSSFVKNVCLLAQEKPLDPHRFFRSCSKILVRRRWPWQFRKPIENLRHFLVTHICCITALL